MVFIKLLYVSPTVWLVASNNFANNILPCIHQYMHSIADKCLWTKWVRLEELITNRYFNKFLGRMQTTNHFISNTMKDKICVHVAKGSQTKYIRHILVQIIIIMVSFQILFCRSRKVLKNPVLLITVSILFKVTFSNTLFHAWLKYTHFNFYVRPSLTSFQLWLFWKERIGDNLV